MPYLALNLPAGDSRLPYGGRTRRAGCPSAESPATDGPQDAHKPSVRNSLTKATSLSSLPIRANFYLALALNGRPHTNASANGAGCQTLRFKPRLILRLRAVLIRPDRK